MLNVAFGKTINLGDTFSVSWITKQFDTYLLYVIFMCFSQYVITFEIFL